LYLYLSIYLGIVANSIVATVKGFALVGGAGFIALFERTDDRREGYVELRRFFVGDHSFITGSLSSSEENLFVLAKNNRYQFFCIFFLCI
jgi:hypothetical protein